MVSQLPNASEFILGFCGQILKETTKGPNEGLVAAAVKI